MKLNVLAFTHMRVLTATDQGVSSYYRQCVGSHACPPQGDSPGSVSLNNHTPTCSGSNMMSAVERHSPVARLSIRLATLVSTVL